MEAQEIKTEPKPEGCTSCGPDGFCGNDHCHTKDKE